MKTIQHRGFYWRYDASADVLHITVDPAIPAYGEDLPNFETLVTVMRGIDDHAVVGLRILGAKANGLQEIKILLDREKRAITDFKVSGTSPGPEPLPDEYVRALEEVEEILEKSPPELQLA